LAVALASLLLAAIALGVWRIVHELRTTGHFRAAKAALDAGDFAAARQHLDHCLKAWPDSAETYFLAARAARRNGDLAEALRLLDGAEKRNWVPEAIELERTLLRVPLGEFPEVEKYLTGWVADDHPESDLILEVLAPAYLRNYQLGPARHFAELWTQRRPQNPRAWACLGAAAERQHDTRGAIDAYRHAVEAAPESRTDRLELVRLLLDAAQSTEALEHLEHLRQHHPDDLAVRLALARCRSLRGQGEEARQLLDEVLTEQPNNAQALAARGRLELNAGRPAQAERWLRRAAQRAPHDRAVIDAFARCLRRTGKGEEAKRWNERLKKVDADLGRLEKVARAAAAAPRDPQPRCEAGVILLRNGMEEEGLRWLTSALRQDPNHPATHRALAEHFERKGQLQQAALHRARSAAGQAKGGGAGPR
jgi:predicted Zn-dependent protease